MFAFSRLIRPNPTFRLVASAPRTFTTSAAAFKTNTSTRTKKNVHDLETFFKLIGRDTLEHLDTFGGNLNRFLNTSSKKMKAQGIDVSTRRYMLRWKHKFVNNLEPLREHKKGTKKNGGERKAKAVKAKKIAIARAEEKERFIAEELEAERKGERQF